MVTGALDRGKSRAGDTGRRVPRVIVGTQAQSRCVTSSGDPNYRKGGGHREGVSRPRPSTTFPIAHNGTEVITDGGVCQLSTCQASNAKEHRALAIWLLAAIIVRSPPSLTGVSESWILATHSGYGYLQGVAGPRSCGIRFASRLSWAELRPARPAF